MANIQMSRRTIALVVAVVLAAIATIALVSYIQGLEDDVIAEGEAVTVFVAKEPIPAGTTADSAIQRAIIAAELIPRRAVVVGAVGSLEEIRGRIAAINILQNEQITAQRFVAPGTARPGQLLNIPRNRVAISVEVGIVPGVAAFIQQGDRVSIIAQLSVPRGGQTENRVQFLLQNVEVLQLGRRVISPEGVPGVSQPADKVLMTLALSKNDSERLAFAILQGQLYFTLQPGSVPSQNTPGRTARNAF